MSEDCCDDGLEGRRGDELSQLSRFCVTKIGPPTAISSLKAWNGVEGKEEDGRKVSERAIERRASKSQIATMPTKPTRGGWSAGDGINKAEG